MKLKKNTADLLAKVAETAAKSAAGSASWWGTHQPKEPKELKMLIKK